MELKNMMREESGKVNDFMEQYRKAIKKVIDEKERIFKEKLKEFSIDFDEETERKRRFPRFTKVRNTEDQDNYGTIVYEHVYFNDGSIDGQRIVTFVERNFLKRTELETTATVEMTYY